MQVELKLSECVRGYGCNPKVWSREQLVLCLYVSSSSRVGDSPGTTLRVVERELQVPGSKIPESKIEKAVLNEDYYIENAPKEKGNNVHEAFSD